uniref:Uncharacterized protein n=1 Tax=viral metagenome TaxID=1070528 RepID=A0A6C0CQJ5_9ZZZZ
MSDTSAIEAKAQGKNDPEERTTNDWGGFAKSVFKNLFHVILLILLIVNTIFYVHNDNMDLFFPTEWDSYFVNPKEKSTMKGGGPNGKCRPHGFSTSMNMKGPSRPKIEFLKEMGLGGSVYGWPYSMYDKNAEHGTFKNWFAEVVAKTYMLSRGAWKKIYGFKPLRGLPDWMFLLLAPVMAIVGMIIAMCSGLIGPIIYGFTQEWAWGVLWTILCLPVFILCLSLPFLQKFLFLFLIMGAPLAINYKEVTDIALCNKNLFGLLFGALVVGSAFQYLVPSVGYSSMILWIIMVIKTIIGK